MSMAQKIFSIRWFVEAQTLRSHKSVGAKFHSFPREDGVKESGIKKDSLYKIYQYFKTNIKRHYQNNLRTELLH